MEDFLFKKLVVWQKAMELARLVYGIVKSFPAEERYALSDQIRREMRRRSSLRRGAGRRPPEGPARGRVVSVPSNIAEGNGRAGDKDYAHFLSIARGSLFEVVTQLELAHSLGFVDDLSSANALSMEIGSMLTAMLKKYGSIHC